MIERSILLTEEIGRTMEIAGIAASSPWIRRRIDPSNAPMTQRSGARFIVRQYDVEFVPRRAIKSQALAYFITEWTDSGLRGIVELSDHWVMYFDGSYTLKGAGAGVVLTHMKVIF
jgi:hypothetical protein